ncbi:MFS transporter [Variovorax sp. ZS18.2.2]|uniref:MFS transporter n=1 Tax=Variovorax sp. ZS18.2.2 TaxID=2971255 RepID=UPI0021515B55|nr:MFS transporter [Variovorax sp. ZS18.2.2]MCR6477105.1 MFS transporter [Variovorax sp. ZS18.2.2]
MPERRQPRPSHRADARAGAREWTGLALLALPTILLGLDLTLLHLALPALAMDLRPTSAEALWIVDAYGFMIAGFLVTMGTLGDRIGRRKLLMLGATAFGVASVMAACASSASQLIAARAVLGVAGATLMPSTLALISNMFLHPHQRALAIGVWATMFALGMAAGPVVGGVLLAHHGWGSAFLVALPVVGLLLMAAPFLLPEYRAPQQGRLDLASVALSLLALLPIVYGIKQIAKDGIGVGAALAVAGGVVFMLLFVRRQRRLSNPLIDLGLFSHRAFSVALVVLLVGLVGVGGTMLLVTQYLQLVAGLSPLAAGLWMGPPALAMLAAGITAPLLARRIRPGHVMAGALGLSAVGYLMLARLDQAPHEHGIALVTASFSLVYLGLGTIAALGTDLVVGAAPAEKAGSASALSETVQELGLAVGIATLGSLTTAVYRTRMVDAAGGLGAPEIQRAVSDSLAGARSVSLNLPAGVLEQAQAAFMAGLQVAAATSAVGIAILAVLAAVMLRHIGVAGGGADEGKS